MMDIYRQLMWYAYGNITQQREQESGGVTEKVKSYIVEHYKDADLNINIIAEKLQRNPRYISRVFKAETDEGILDFINRIRIDKAKILFELGGCTVEEVMTNDELEKAYGIPAAMLKHNETLTREELAEQVKLFGNK